MKVPTTRLKSIYHKDNFAKVMGPGGRGARLQVKARFHARHCSGLGNQTLGVTVPRFWAREVAATQLVNVNGHDVLPLVEAGVFAMPFFEVPADQVKVFHGHSSVQAALPLGLRQYLFPNSGHIRFFVDPYDVARSQIAREAGWSVDNRTVARTSSVSTVSVAPKEGEDFTFDVKTDREVHRESRGLTFFQVSDQMLSELTRRSEVLVDRFSASKDSRAGVFAEPVAFLTEQKQTRFIQIVRSKDAFGGQKAQDATVVPAHSILGNLREGAPDLDLVARYAEKAGIDQEQWLMDFTYRLGEFVGHSLINLGVIAQIHGQNLMVEVDEETGRVTRFILKDLFDVQMDPLACLFDPQNQSVSTLPNLGYLSYFQSTQLEYNSDEEVYISRPNPNNPKMYKALSDGVLSHIVDRLGVSSLPFFLAGVRTAAGLDSDFSGYVSDMQGAIRELERLRFISLQAKFFKTGVTAQPKATNDELLRLTSNSGKLLLVSSLTDEVGVSKYIDTWNSQKIKDKLIKAWTTRSIEELAKINIEIKQWDGKLVIYDNSFQAVLGVFVPD